MIQRFPVISCWQPWASWIIAGWKPIETRTHNRFWSLKGRTILIHAAQTWDHRAIAMARDHLSREQLDQAQLLMVPLHAPTPCCQIIGSVDVIEHRRLTADDSAGALCWCGDGDLFGLFLATPRPLKDPIRINGRQGIWYADVEEELFK